LDFAEHICFFVSVPAAIVWKVLAVFATEWVSAANLSFAENDKQSASLGKNLLETMLLPVVFPEHTRNMADGG
jgi:hypothetical protein